MYKFARFYGNAYGILKRMKGGNKARGFTIIETLIVLAVTGGLFVAAAVAISGRQARTQFDQGIQEVRSQLQRAIDEVAVGYYPNTSNFSCSAGAFGPTLSGASANQGENTGCIFLGKAIQFDTQGTDPEEYRVFTIAGLQKNASGQEVTTYAEARPVVVSPSTSSPSRPDASESKKMEHGLTTLWVRHGAGAPTGGTDIGAIAFVNSLAEYSSGSIVSGTQTVNVIPINNTALNVNQNTAADAINNNLATSGVNPADGVRICFVSGGTDQSGLITIGSNDRQLSVTLSIKGNKTCA